MICGKEENRPRLVCSWNLIVEGLGGHKSEQGQEAEDLGQPSAEGFPGIDHVNWFKRISLPLLKKKINYH